jgi:hypothetical protein
VRANNIPKVVMKVTILKRIKPSVCLAVNDAIRKRVTKFALRPFTTINNCASLALCHSGFLFALLWSPSGVIITRMIDAGPEQLKFGDNLNSSI